MSHYHETAIRKDDEDENSAYWIAIARRAWARFLALGCWWENELIQNGGGSTHKRQALYFERMADDAKNNSALGHLMAEAKKCKTH